MSGFFGDGHSGDIGAEQIAREQLDPKGALEYEATYFRHRVTELSSIYADDDAMTEGMSDYWIYRDERYTERKERELIAYQDAVAAVAKFIRARQRTERMRNQIQEEVGPLLEANIQIATMPVMTTADFENDNCPETDDKPSS
jgi:hypothetical protein